MNDKYGAFVVYGLRDPANKKIFYVGRTTDPNARYSKHIAEAEEYKKTINARNTPGRLFNMSPIQQQQNKSSRSFNRAKVEWILNILDRNEKPDLIELDRWEADTIQDANRLEEPWIAKMRMDGHPLTNFITSRRMEPWWYSEDREGFKKGYAASPEEYIERVKNGKIKQSENTRKYKPAKKRKPTKPRRKRKPTKPTKKYSPKKRR